MNKDASQSSSSIEIARRLLAREAAPGREHEPAKAAAALQQTCLRVIETLRDSMGGDGTNALLVRALARTEAEHPALKKVTRINGINIHLDGVAASVEAHGIAAVTAALEALLAALIDSLGRLIGEDMAIRLMNHDDPLPRRRGATEAP
jgi:hypothetical protein